MGRLGPSFAVLPPHCVILIVEGLQKSGTMQSKRQALLLPLAFSATHSVLSVSERVICVPAPYRFHRLSCFF